MNTINNEQILRKCIKFVQRNPKIILENEKEKRECGGVLVVKSHTAYQSDLNCTTQIQTICKYGKCVLHRFFFL
jgi:hypothetical protein